VRVNFHHRPPLLKFADLHAAVPRTPDWANIVQIDEEIEIGCSRPLSSADIEFLFEYNIFPPTIMDFVAEWVVCGRPMRAGDVIIQRAFIPPIGAGLCLEFGVRIVKVYDEETRRGFEYESLGGHPEAGTSKFCFEKRGNSTKFRIKTESSPGNALSRMLSGIFTHKYQRWCTSRALENVKNKFIQRNATLCPLPPHRRGSGIFMK
jgi:hypothetical protein